MRKTLLILFFIFGNYCYAQITPESFNLKLKEGQVDTDRMSRLQKDTIILDFFTETDRYIDIAVCYRIKNEIVVFKNLGNGFLDTLKKLPLEKSVDKIESYRTGYHPVFILPPAEIKLYFTDGGQHIIRSREINSISDSYQMSGPVRDISNDPKIFLYDFQFVQKWISQRRSAPVNQWCPRGDVDNDGKNEFIYTFYPINETLQVFTPGHIIVFESYLDDKVRVDWDTIFYQNACGTFFDEFFDFDRNGKKEFYARAPNPLTGQVTTGLFECSGEGKYKFHSANEIDGGGLFVGYIARDTMKMTNSLKPGIWVNYYATPPTSYSKIRGHVFTQRSQYSYNFAYLVNNGAYAGVGPQTVYDMDVGEIDGDSQEEILVGDNQWETNYFHYLDSTGSSTNAGYQLRTAIPGADVSGGFMNLMNYDENESKEITMCGISSPGWGSLGVIKHTGSPGQNQFSTMWWDSVGIDAAPNWGIDTGTINKEFMVLYPFLNGSGVFTRDNIMTRSRNGLYSYYTSSLTLIDSLALFNPRFIDLDNDNRVNIVAPGGVGYPGRFYVFVLEYDGLTFMSQQVNNQPFAYSLSQNYPNPFNPKTKIQFSISSHSNRNTNVKLVVYNSIGQEIIILVNGEKSEGNYEVHFDGSNLSSGVYFYSLYLDNVKVDVKKMLLLK